LFALSFILEDASYHVRAFSGAAQMLEGNLSRIDLFILDKQMPDVDGLDVCRYLRTQPATRDTPLILISAQSKKALKHF
jgi:CheY-like chemotaxis protein